MLDPFTGLEVLVWSSDRLIARWKPTGDTHNIKKFRQEFLYFLCNISSHLSRWQFFFRNSRFVFPVGFPYVLQLSLQVSCTDGSELVYRIVVAVFCFSNHNSQEWKWAYIDLCRHDRLTNTALAWCYFSLCVMVAYIENYFLDMTWKSIQSILFRVFWLSLRLAVREGRSGFVPLKTS